MSDLHLGRMRDQKSWSEVGEQGPLGGGVWSRRLEQQLKGDLQALDRVTQSAGGRADLVGGAGQCFLEQCQQQLVFTAELQVENSHRLTRAVDDLLDGEVGAALFDDDRLSGIKESLDALRGLELSG